MKPLNRIVIVVRDFSTTVPPALTTQIMKAGNTVEVPLTRFKQAMTVARRHRWDTQVWVVPSQHAKRFKELSGILMKRGWFKKVSVVPYG